MMKRLVSLLCTVALLAACDKTPVAHIDATVDRAPDSSVVLQKLNHSRLVAVDTIRTDAKGHFDYKVKLTGNPPYFYYLYLGDAPVASMILLPDDKVTVKVPVGGGFEIEGSEESALLQQVNNRFATAIDAMGAVTESVGENSTEAEVRAANAALSKIYIDYKREAIKHVVSHPKSITSAVVLFQRFNDNLPVFGDATDAILFKNLQDSLSLVYPNSEFLVSLRDEVTARERDLDLAGKLGSAGVISFPELVMPDVDGQLRRLSDLEGQVIVLSFWSVAQTEHKLFNVELAELYQKYHAQGLEVYQVGLDIDKPSWAAVVRNMNLPWISVNDGYGIGSSSVVAYNVDHIPMMYVFDRQGEVAGVDVFDKAALEQLIRKSL